MTFPLIDFLSAHNWMALTGAAVTAEASLSPFRCLNQPWQPHSQTASLGFSADHCGQMTKALFSSPILYPACPHFRKQMTVGRSGSLRVGGIFVGL